MPAGLSAQQSGVDGREGSLTVPERTGYAETSTTAEVGAFLDSLVARGAPVTVSEMGRSAGGRPLHLVVASDPPITSPGEAAKAGKMVVYLQGNIHGGEVEGKEALQILLRELAGAHRELLEDLVLLVAPVYNPDGNDALGPQERHRPNQDGPRRVGRRPDGLNLDLNRDYLKAEAPETRASLAEIYLRWDPALMMDLHATDGTRHGYHLTYSPPLHPNGPEGPTAYVRDELLPAVRRAMDEKHDTPVFVYGNVRDAEAPEAWTTYAPLGWYGTNYVGLRGRMAVLSEAYSHADFRTRVEATHDFVLETLRYAADHADEIRGILREADRHTALEGTGERERPDLGVRFRPSSRGVEPVRLERMERVTEGGEEELRPTGELRTAELPIRDRFESTRTRRLPAGYVLPGTEGRIVRLLRRHGLRVLRLEADWTGEVEQFDVSEAARAERHFQGHPLLELEGEYRTAERTVGKGAYYVPTAQPLGRLAFTLLEPEGYGLARWNFFDRLLGTEVGALSGLVYGSELVDAFPVLRTRRTPDVPMEAVR